jgi:endonuclease/exonuclease/phosphatase family metal-dependent hydrolase
MKIITLNAWGGIAGTQGLLDFFKKYEDVDIFCLQEIYDGGDGQDEAEKLGNDKNKEYELFSLIQKTLPDHTGYFRPSVKEFYGIAIFIKTNIIVLEEGEKFVHKHKGFLPEDNLGFHARNIQYVKIQKDGKDFCVINFHGLWNGQGKHDSEDRINQSKNILEFTAGIQGELVLCGDFNLRPDTESLKAFENVGLKNLIREYNITSTRTSHYTKEEKFADYAFTTPGIVVKDFKVLPEEVSDHAALFIEIE